MSIGLQDLDDRRWEDYHPHQGKRVDNGDHEEQVANDADREIDSKDDLADHLIVCSFTEEVLKRRKSRTTRTVNNAKILTWILSFTKPPKRSKRSVMK